MNANSRIAADAPEKAICCSCRWIALSTIHSDGYARQLWCDTTPTATKHTRSSLAAASIPGTYLTVGFARRDSQPQSQAFSRSRSIRSVLETSISPSFVTPDRAANIVYALNACSWRIKTRHVNIEDEAGRSMRLNTVTFHFITDVKIRHQMR